MPRHQYIGKQVDKTNNYIQTNVTFEDIFNNPKMENISKPNYQGSLVEEKIEKMSEEYLKNPLLLKFKNHIIIGCLQNNWYIIDGQHRIEMAKSLYSNHGVNDHLVFCWYICSAEEIMKDIFRSVNIDSLKNQYYVSDNDIKQIIKEEFTGKLKDYHKTHFANRKTDTGKTKTIEEFVIELDTINFFGKFTNSQEAYNSLKEENNEFFNVNRYSINLEQNPTIYYAPEKKLINEKVIFTLKRNNFVEWLGDKTNDPYHNTRAIKANISTYKRKAVWSREFGENDTGVCPISFCNVILKTGVKNGFQCGHIQSEYNGGVTDVINLRPICSGCNQSMGKTNWGNWDIVQ
tara:strand:+ start:117 stop:1157 length:1041 start_codon:yes stop_codon:yes gene_type:complete